MIALGLDAGLAVGWSLLDVDPRGPGKRLAGGVLDRNHRVVELVAVLAPREVELVVIESPEGFAYPGREHAVDRLLEAGRIGGELGGACLSRGLPVITCSAATVRQALCRRRGATDAEVERTLRVLVPGWPKARTTVSHERDAAMAALFGARTQALRDRGLLPVTPPPRRPRAQRSARAGRA